MNRQLTVLGIGALLLLAACTPVAYTPVPLSVSIAQATLDTGVYQTQAAATVTSAAAQAFDRDSTSTAVANAATALAATPTAQALALQMAREADAATQAAAETAAVRTATAAWAPTRAAETQVAATRTATAQAGLEQAARYDEIQRHAQAVQDQLRWNDFVRFVTAVICTSLGGAALIGLAYLAGMAWQRVQTVRYRADQERYKAFVELVRRNGDVLFRIAPDGRSVEMIDRPDRPEPSVPAVRQVGQIPHIPVTIDGVPHHELEMGGGGSVRSDVLELLDATLAYQAQHPEWPRQKIPSCHKLGWGGDRWKIAKDALGEYVSSGAGNTNGTFVAGRFADVSDLRERVATGAAPLF